jgi:hypothetical protein
MSVIAGCSATDDVMDEFSGIRVVSGLVELSENDAVTNMQGYRGLHAIGSDLVIKNNDGLASLAGLQGSRLVIEGDLIIRSNPSLSSIAALAGVTVRGRLGILFVRRTVAHAFGCAARRL